MSICPVEDDYSVKVALEDDSLYAFNPRRFAWSERLQIKEITDDLLKRNIKHSTSPYCARVVPIRKKNGSIRLCIDLRPLNSRVIKQHYPFPNTEDCLSRLNDMTVFSILDLKDGFHHIKIHPEHILHLLHRRVSLSISDCRLVTVKLRQNFRSDLTF